MWLQMWLQMWLRVRGAARRVRAGALQVPARSAHRRQKVPYGMAEGTSEAWTVRSGSRALSSASISDVLPSSSKVAHHASKAAASGAEVKLAELASIARIRSSRRVAPAPGRCGVAGGLRTPWVSAH